MKICNMNLIDKIIDAFIGRMSQEDKERLMEKVMEKFFNNMTPEEKQKLIEKMIPILLESLNMKELFSYMMKTVWKGSETDDDRSGILDTVSKMASETGGKISEMLPSQIKKML